MLPRFKRNIVASADGTLIAYESFGDGPAVVLCNGLGCNRYIWRYVLPALRNEFRVITWDYRCHGNSQDVDESLISMEKVMEDLTAVLDDDGIERAALCGFSMGSQVIFEFAGRFPERVTGLFSLCGGFEYAVSGMVGGPMAKRLGPALRTMFKTFGPLFKPVYRQMMPTYISYLVAAATAVNPALLNPKDMESFFRHMGEIEPLHYITFAEMADEHSAREYLPNLSMPALIIGGAKDNMAPPSMQEELDSLLPNSELIIVPQGTHTAALEQPDLVTLAVQRFLKTRVLPSIQMTATNGAEPHSATGATAQQDG